MASIHESCSVCGAAFDVQFRYQMEERDGAFWFFCSQRCLEHDQAGGSVSCDACGKGFRPELAAQVLYVAGHRRYACSLSCRSQLVQESKGAKLGDPAPRPAPEAAIPVFAEPRVRPATPPPARAAAPRVIAVFNHKGGTGKTTTAVSLAAALARRGRRVLLVDTDAQGNVAVSLGAPAERGLYHVMVMGLRLSDAVREVRPGLDLLPSNETLAAAELYLAGRQNRDRVLATRLAQGTEGYDFVVVDCSPSLSLMNQNALVFADSVLVPVGCDYLSLVGVRQVVKTVKNVNALLHHPVQIWGVLPTFYDARARICRDAVATMKEHFGERCLAPIRAAIKVKEAPAQGETIFEYAASSTAAEDYLALADRVVEARAAAERGRREQAVGAQQPATA